MRLSKFLSFVGFLTFFSLVYVHQQSEIIRLSYIIQKTQTKAEELLDKNASLRYNIKKNSSLVKLGNKLDTSADFQIPESYRLVRLIPSSSGTKLLEAGAQRETFFSRLFSIRKQAEAKQ